MPTTEQTSPKKEDGSSVTQEFINVKTFRTLGGSVAVSGVAATVISGVFSLDPKIVGFIVCLCVAYVGLFLAKKRKRSDYVLSLFNGFLIYFTLVGASSFYPYLNPNTAAHVVADGATNAPASAFGPWVPDKNLVSASRDLVRVHHEQTAVLNTVQTNVVALESQIRTANIPQATKIELSAGLAANRNLILTTRTNISPRVRSLERMGIR